MTYTDETLAYMRYTWDRAFADGRGSALTGDAAGRMLDACAKLRFDGTHCAVGAEIPLLGPPNADVLVILPGERFYPGCRLYDPAQRTAQAVVDWVSRLGDTKADIFFELDAAGTAGADATGTGSPDISGTRASGLAGAYCRLEGRTDLAQGFFGALGEPERAAVFVRAADRLPEGWLCLYGAAFPGRAAGRTRLEVMIYGQEARASISHPEYLRECFDGMGFAAFDDEMLRDMARIAAVGVPLTLQLDLAPDGSFGPDISLVSSYEHIRPDVRPLFAEEGALYRICRMYEAMGTADFRWQRLEESCFAVKRTLLTPQGVRDVIHRSLPCCTKARWKGGRRAPAKYYAMLDARVVRPGADSYHRG